uniref:Glutathione S-transferase 1 n=1 Tax=Cacopsylla melanoneura TaxID=428564 RepID=A0A8D9FG54_9HEMI
MGLILHEISASPPVRAVKLCLKELGLEAEYKLCNLLAREQLSPEYIEKNPQHTVPTLEDGDFIIWDSHAINGYLVSTYGKNDALYPKDPKVRALVDQRLHFDTGILFSALRNIGAKIFFAGEKEVREEDQKKVREALAFLEKFLEGKKFITGDTYNIADFSVYTTASCLLVFVPELDKYPNVAKYFDNCKSAFKGISTDDEGLQAFKDLFKKATSG